MRTKLFLVAVLAGMLSLTSVNASSITTESAQSEVEATLQQVFKAIPLEDFIESEENVQVYFSVNYNNEITNVKVYADNYELANYVYQVLTENKITLTNARPDNYNVNLVFDIK